MREFGRRFPDYTQFCANCAICGVDLLFFKIAQSARKKMLEKKICAKCAILGAGRLFFQIGAKCAKKKIGIEILRKVR